GRVREPALHGDAARLSVRMVMAVRAIEVRVRMRVMVMIAARMRVRAVRVLVRRMALGRRRVLGLDGRRLLLDLDVLARRRLGARDECAAPARSHGFFFGGAGDIFFLSGGSSSSALPALPLDFGGAVCAPDFGGDFGGGALPPG